MTLTDAQWFLRHPKRSYRIRPPQKGEPAGLILVHQLFPGARMRLNVQVNPRLMRDPLSLTDAELATLWSEGELPLVWGTA